MLNRTITLISATLSILVVFGTFFALYIAADRGLSMDALLANKGFLTYVAFVVLMLIGAILTIVSLAKKSGNILVIATLFLIASSIPAAMYNLSLGTVKNPYLLSIMSGPSIIINILQLILLRMGVTNYDSGIKAVMQKRKKK